MNLSFLSILIRMAIVEDLSERKSYGQVCPMATALDFVGDRWTILILRELLGGPARFQDLRNGLPGIATNLLTERLRRMESDGIIRNTPVQGLYVLTEAGAGIRTAIEELGIWGAGMARVGPVVYERSARAIAMALQAVLVRAGDRLPAETCIIELEVDGDPAEIILGPRPTVTARMSTQPDARVAVSATAISAFLRGETTAAAAFSHISGDELSTQRLIAAFDD